MKQRYIESHEDWDLHWVGGVPVDVVQPVGGRGCLADQLDQHQQKVDDHFGRHFIRFSYRLI